MQVHTSYRLKRPACLVGRMGVDVLRYREWRFASPRFALLGASSHRLRMRVRR